MGKKKKGEKKEKRVMEAEGRPKPLTKREREEKEEEDCQTKEDWRIDHILCSVFVHDDCNCKGMMLVTCSHHTSTPYAQA